MIIPIDAEKSFKKKAILIQDNMFKMFYKEVLLDFVVIVVDLAWEQGYYV